MGMTANLIKSIRKSLGNEALEKRISELEQTVAGLSASITNLVGAGFAGMRSEQRLEERIAALEAKKRKPRAKTSGTE